MLTIVWLNIDKLIVAQPVKKDYLQKGANISTVQELLGHTSLAVTERYLAVTDQDKLWAVGLLDGSSRG